MFENPRRGRQARNFTTNVPKILDLKSSSEQIFFPKLSLGAPDLSDGIAKDRPVYLAFHIPIFWSQERSTDHKLRKRVGRE